MNETVTGFEYPVYKEKTTPSSRNLQIMWDINNLDNSKFFDEIREFWFCLTNELTRQYRSPNTTPVPLCSKKDILGFSL